jgi:nitrate reductase gamma subunit
MYSLYQFVTGPLAWVSFAIFLIGVVIRFVLYMKGLNWQADRVTYTVNFSYGLKGAFRSVFHWLIPFGTRSWRVNPGFTILFFVFHFGLLFTPIFLQAHNILLKERWGFSLWTIPDALADFLTIAMIIAAVFLILRRIALPEVRILTSIYDYIVLAIAVAPFITGFLASQNAAGYNSWLILHIISGEIMLVAIPFTKLSHFILFFCSRAQIGMDFGIKRGGMKSKGLAW